MAAGYTCIFQIDEEYEEYRKSKILTHSTLSL